MRSLLTFLLLVMAQGIASSQNQVFEVPEGFSVTHFAGDDLAHDIWSMTINDHDRICVGGPGYIKFLLDTDNDGIADRAQTFTENVRTGPMGLLVDGDSIISVESNAVIRHVDENGDLKADGKPQVLVDFTGKGGEHGPHGIRKGPDGWYYVVCGNNTGVDESHSNLIGVPPLIKKPNQGCIIRIAPDGTGSEVIAHGFRNPYDIAFSDDGRLFTYDSDNERDHHLPWYASTRVFDVAFGRHHGWLNPGYKQSYNTPEYYTIDRLAETRRGSPTGVEHYWHNAFPEHYRKGLFFACWTFGRIYYAPLEWVDDSGLLQERQLKKQSPEIFAKAGAEGGFAPVDLGVDSKGNLWVACGGRNTSGNVYCISPPNGPGETKIRNASLPQMMVGRNVIKPQLQHPHTVRTFLKNQEDLHLVYRAYQESSGGINHRPEPRAADAGYSFNILPSEDSLALRDAIISESGATLLFDMDVKAEQALTKDAEAFAEFWSQPEKPLLVEPWRSRNYKELARTLGCIKTDLTPVLENLTTALREDTHPTDDLHYLFCMAQIPAQRTSIATWRIASAFLQIDAKLAAIPGAHPSRNWPLRISELFEVHCEKAPNLGKEVMWSHSLFGSSIYHSRYVNLIPDPALKKEVTEKMYYRIRDSKEKWTASWTALLKENLPDLEVSEIRQAWDKQPQARHLLADWFVTKADVFDDTSRLFEMMEIGDEKVVEQAVEKLKIRDLPRSADQTRTVLISLIKFQKHRPTQQALLSLLGANSLEEALTKAQKEFPESVEIASLAGPQGTDEFLKRLPEIDWAAGAPEKGKQLYTKLTCSVCHSGQNRLGPSLKAVSARFGRDDFFRHTVNPNLAISDLYRAVEISTRDGKTHIGVPVYSSPDQTILETGPGKTINLSQGQVIDSKPVSTSPMPPGLLLGLSDSDLADLWAYVKTL